MIGKAAAPGSPWTDARPLAVGPVTVLTPAPGARDVVELGMPLTATFSNPFDIRDIAVEAECAGPGGTRFTQPGFFMVPFTRSGGGGSPAGPGMWRIRFMPPLPGGWTVTVRAKDRSGERAAPPVRIEVAATGAPGVIRRAAGDDRYFSYESGAPFLPVGLNVCWPERGGLDDFGRWFTQMGEAGANWARVWMIEWSLGLENTPDHWSGDGHGAGVYNLANAWRVDEVFRMARVHGVTIQLCLDSFNTLKASEGNDAWKMNPYAKAGGGWLAQPADYWNDPESRRLALQRLRYTVARWGANPNLFAWEFWNEVDGTDGYETERVTAWHRDLGRALRALDPARHLITTSYGDPQGDAHVWALPEMEFVQAHSYNLTDTAAQLAGTVGVQRRFGKPVIVGEFGANVDEDRWVKSHDDPHGIHLATAAWAIPLAGAAGTPMIWYWGNYVDRYGLWPHFKAVHAFLDGVDWPAEHFVPVPQAALTFRAPPPAGAYRDVVLRPNDTGWASRQRAYSLRDDGTLDPGDGFSQFLYGEGKPEARSTLLLRGDFREAAALAIRILVVSGPARLVVRADGATVFTHNFNPGPGKGEWAKVDYHPEWKVYQNIYDRDYTARIPAGTKEIALENAPGDWMTFGSIRIMPYRKSPKPPADLYGLAGKDTTLVYLKHEGYTWTTPKPAVPCPASRLTLAGCTTGRFRVALVETKTGAARSTTELDGSPAGLTVDLPAIATDLAVRVDRVRPATAPAPAVPALPLPAGSVRYRAKVWRDRFEREVRQGILAFWLAHGPDPRGGFYGGLDRQGRPDLKAPKSLVEQSRVIYAFSAAYRQFPDERYRQAAKAQFDWFTKTYWDPGYGGWYWSVSPDGRPLDRHKHLYGQSFALLALVEYSRAFNDGRSGKLGYVTFHRMDMHAHDKLHHGYDEAWTQDWKREPAGSPIDAAGRRSANTHLHLLESFTALLRLNGTQDVYDRTLELVDLFRTKMTDPAGYAYEFYGPDWTPQTRNASYGHDVELAWLMHETALATGHAPDEPAVVAYSRGLVDHTLAHGFDPVRGGIFESGPGGQPATLRSKTWWAQAEALVGFLDAWSISGDEKYFTAFEKTADFVLREVSDAEYGDWFPQFREDGTRDGDTKASAWKDPYHQTRACLEVIRRLGELQSENR